MGSLQRKPTQAWREHPLKSATSAPRCQCKHIMSSALSLGKSYEFKDDSVPSIWMIISLFSSRFMGGSIPARNDSTLSPVVEKSSMENPSFCRVMKSGLMTKRAECQVQRARCDCSQGLSPAQRRCWVPLFGGGSSAFNSERAGGCDAAWR